jgi:hypothetical protein
MHRYDEEITQRCSEMEGMSSLAKRTPTPINKEDDEGEEMIICYVGV